MRAPIWKRAASWPLIGGGLVLAIPTVGMSLVVTVYGVFMRVPAECDCGRVAADLDGAA